MQDEDDDLAGLRFLREQLLYALEVIKSPHTSSRARTKGAVRIGELTMQAIDLALLKLTEARRQQQLTGDPV